MAPKYFYITHLIKQVIEMDWVFFHFITEEYTQMMLRGQP